MPQSRFDSLLESFANIAVGFLIALATQLVTFYAYDVETSFSTNLQITAWFTLVSFIRGYLLRRYFNGRIFRLGGHDE
jgi:hypothetical protein